MGKARAFIDKVNTVSQKSIGQLMATIAGGLTSVTVNAMSSVFQGYISGLVKSSSCNTLLNYAITSVGYRNDWTQDFNTVRNSLTASWGVDHIPISCIRGDKRYIKIAAVEGAVGICGIQQNSVWQTMKPDANSNKSHEWTWSSNILNLN